ncbi:MAG: NAD(P)-binding domain-containing protein, partial [Bacteroidales bacterium]|nr:NAD(P)-binding domain-containing protein [Bacteroidales bacterium]
MKITIIGAGNMGGAIARGLAKGSIFSDNDITCTAKSIATLEKLRATNPGFTLLTDNQQAVKGADIVVFAVKPWLMKEVIEQVRPALLPDSQIYISVAAGITCQELQEWTGSSSVIRVIPNTAIEIQESMTFITAASLDMPHLQLAEKIFSQL